MLVSININMSFRIERQIQYMYLYKHAHACVCMCMYLGHFGKVHQALRVVGLGVHVERVDLVQVRSDVGEGIGRLAAGREGGEGGEGGDSTSVCI